MGSLNKNCVFFNFLFWKSPPRPGFHFWTYKFQGSRFARCVYIYTYIYTVYIPIVGGKLLGGSVRVHQPRNQTCTFPSQWRSDWRGVSGTDLPTDPCLLDRLEWSLEDFDCDCLRAEAAPPWRGCFNRKLHAPVKTKHIVYFIILYKICLRGKPMVGCW